MNSSWIKLFYLIFGERCEWHTKYSPLLPKYKRYLPINMGNVGNMCKAIRPIVDTTTPLKIRKMISSTLVTEIVPQKSVPNDTVMIFLSGQCVPEDDCFSTMVAKTFGTTVVKFQFDLLHEKVRAIIDHYSECYSKVVLVGYKFGVETLVTYMNSVKWTDPVIMISPQNEIVGLEYVGHKVKLIHNLCNDVNYDLLGGIYEVSMIFGSSEYILDNIKADDIECVMNDIL